MPSALSILWRVGRLGSSCGVSDARPSAIASTASTSARAPIRAMSRSTSALVSCSPIARAALEIIGPASSALTTRMIVTPVIVSPAITAR